MEETWEGVKVDLFEAIDTNRSIRRYRPDPIPDEHLRRILQAGINAPSGGNRQNWRFVVVRDPDQRKRVQEIYQAATTLRYNRGYFDLPPDATEEERAAVAQRRASGERFAATLHEAPVIIVPCLRVPGGGQPAFSDGASIYPAVQNMMLAARALGIGSVITTNHRFSHERELCQLLGLPDDVMTCAIVPFGYPRGRFGPLNRRPLEEVCFEDRFGQPITW